MPVSFDNLVVVDLGDNLVPDKGDCVKHGFFIPQTCAHSLLVVTREDWENNVPRSIRARALTHEEAEREQKETGEDPFLRKKSPAFHVESGDAAYNLLLRIAIGLQSSKTMEEQIGGQLREAWKTHLQNRPDKAKALEGMVCTTLGDASHIQGGIVKQQTRPTLESAARNLSGINNTHAVIIVASDDIGETMALVHALGKQSRNSASEILILHPDNIPNKDHVRLLQENVERIEAKNMVAAKCDVLQMNPEDVREYFALADVIFMPGTLGSNPAVDKMVQDHFDPKESSLVLMRAGGNRTMAQEWHDIANQGNIIWPDAVSAEFATETKQFDAMVAMAENAVINCLHSRQQGKVPRGAETLGVPPEEYAVPASRFAAAAKRPESGHAR